MQTNSFDERTCTLSRGNIEGIACLILESYSTNIPQGGVEGTLPLHPDKHNEEPQSMMEWDPEN